MNIRAILLAIGVFHSLLSFSQAIDSLQTDAQVLSFVNKKVNNDSIFLIPPKPSYAVEDFRIRRFGYQPYEKADFDGNGHMDLLFNGYTHYSKIENSAWLQTCFVVLSFGKDSFSVKYLTPGSIGDFFTARKIELDGNQCIETLRIRVQWIDSIKYTEHKSMDTLIYLYDDFIERAIPNDHVIKKIEYCSSGGLRALPRFKFSITDTIAIMQIEPSTILSGTVLGSGGIFRARLDPLSYYRILGLLQHIDFPGLRDSYTVTSTDASIESIKISYDDGKIKQINDEGSGTYGLAALERIFFKLIDTQHWTTIKKGDDNFFIECN